MQIFVQWAKRTASVPQRIVIIGIGALLFPILIPSLLIAVIPKLDRLWGVEFLLFGSVGFFIGASMMLLGGIIALWTIAVQITQASGTPFPMLPTRKLITGGPFAMCRNPMTFGTILLYGGLSLLIGSIASILAVMLFAAFLLFYIKMIEEKELHLRFGEEYVKYKAETPLIIPNLLKLKRK